MTPNIITFVKGFIDYYDRGYLNPNNVKFLRTPYVPVKDERGKYVGVKALEPYIDVFNFIKNVFNRTTLLSDVTFWRQYDFAFLDFCRNEGLTQRISKEEYNKICARYDIKSRCYEEKYIEVLYTDHHHEYIIKSLLDKFYKYCTQLKTDNQWT